MSSLSTCALVTRRPTTCVTHECLLVSSAQPIEPPPTKPITLSKLRNPLERNVLMFSIREQERNICYRPPRNAYAYADLDSVVMRVVLRDPGARRRREPRSIGGCRRL